VFAYARPETLREAIDLVAGGGRPLAGGTDLLVGLRKGKFSAELVVGFAAHAPAEDPDLDAATTAELVTLLVDPVHGRAGHGSRLLAATADLLGEDGFATVVCWVFEQDAVMRRFLGSAGWAPDGARRVLDMGEPVPMIRMHTDISGGTRRL